MKIHIFEALMLICFGAAWPSSIYKSFVSRSTGGKSVVFLIIIDAGYLCGIINKFLYSRDIVMALYCLNFLMVLCDILLWFRNRRLETSVL